MSALLIPPPPTNSPGRSLYTSFWKEKSSDVGSGANCCSSRPVGYHQFKIGSGQEYIIPLHFLLNNVMVDPVRASDQ